MSVPLLIRPRRLARLVRSDMLNIGRDPTLMFSVCLSAVLPLALWHWRTDLDRMASSAFPVAGISAYFVPVTLALPPFLIGWVSGFLLLEDREDGPLFALEVSPPGKTGFALYRVGLTALACFILTAFSATALLPDPYAVDVLLMATLTGLEACAVALALPAIAGNRVEGLALTKLLNLFSIAPLLALLPSPYRLFSGVVPTTWLGIFARTGGEIGIPWALAAALALAVHLAICALVFRLYAKRIG